ncbi:transglycosylase SLT domain-containing protein [Rhodococcus sp. UFZ-B548]|uniref:transglycosylase SLT domain-containing protein n=1 Tax=Rhodococcus sp. UFZ-B548 TaxID=2742212 RepID=UPI0015F51EDB|nr:transglycosylase SLT domain-containing protein [Rhodococcus sp. UFZ-B548]
MSVQFQAGTASIAIGPDLTGFHRKVKVRLRSERIEAPVIVVPNFDNFRQKLETGLGRFNANIKVTVSPDLSGFRQQLRADLAAGSAGADIEVPLRLDLTLAREQLRLFRIEANQAMRADFDLDITAALARLATLRAASQGIGSTANIGGGAGRRGNDRLGGSLSSVGTSGLKYTAIAAGIGAIGGAAGLAAGAVGALAAGLGAVGIAGAAGMATTVVGLNGVKDAFTSLAAEAKSSVSDAQAKAKSVASAQKGVEQANRGVESATRGVEQANRSLEQAEKGVARAHQSAQDAQEDLTRARKDAQEQIEDLNLALKGSALDERGAELAVRRAEQQLRDLWKGGQPVTQLDIAEAVLGVDEAKQRLDEVRERNGDLRTEVDAANKAGVEGSEQVVSAKEAIAEADDRVKEAELGVQDAQLGVADANRGVVEAVQGVVEAQAALQEANSATSSSADKAAEAMAKLSPSAAGFVLAMRELGPAWSDVRKSTQENMFAGLDASFTNLAQVSMPMLKEGFGEVATSINGAATNFSDFFASAAAQDSLRNIFAGTADLITGMQPGLAAITGGILDIGNAAAPVMGQLGESLGNVLGGIGTAFSDAFESGALTELIGNFSSILDGLGGGLNGLLDGLIQFGNIVGPVIGPVLQTLGESIGALAPSLGQLGVAFGDALVKILPDLSKFISALADGLTPVMPIVAELLGSLGTALTPLIPPLSQIIQTIGTALVKAVDALAPAIGPLGTAFASLVEALAPFLPMAAEVISVLVQALAPALQKIFEALGPVIDQWLTGMKPVLEKLAPILADVAMQLGTAIADALVQIMPLLPTLIDSFSRIVLAITPFIPQLIQIGTDLLPVLIDLFVVLVETVLPPLTRAIEWIAEHVLPLVVEGIRSFAQSWGEKLTEAKDAVLGAKEFIGETFEKVKGTLTDLKNFFGNIVESIGNVWDGLKDKVAGPINWIIDNVINGALKDAWNAVAFVIPGLERWDGIPRHGKSEGGPELVQRYATGGHVRGRGGPTDDLIDAKLSNGEYVMRASAVDKIGVANLDRLNNNPLIAKGKVLAEGMFTGIRMKVGGSVDEAVARAKGFMQHESGKPYQYGGTGDPSWDCSGLWSGIVNELSGRPATSGRLFNTESDFESMGWKPGLDGRVTIGIMRGGGGENSHMAGTLDGTNAESSGDNGVQWGGPARGSDNSMFGLQYTLQELAGQFASGGQGGGMGGLFRSVINTVYKPAAAAFEAASSALGSRIPDFGPSLVGQIPKVAFTAIKDALSSAIRNAMGSSGDSGNTPFDIGAGAEQWRSKVIEALQREGFDANERNQNLMLAQIQSESGGNPNIVQSVQDVNSGGNEAVGLLQVIPGTFATYRNPDLPNDRTDPDASMSAALRYYRSRYGDDLGAMWGQGHGYALGGIIPGYRPGQDKFQVGVSGGESIMRPEWTRAVGSSFVDGMNSIARKQGVEGVQRAMGAGVMGMFAEGGVFTPEEQRLYLEGRLSKFGTQAGDIAKKALPEILGVQGTPLDPNHRYWQAAMDIQSAAMGAQAVGPVVSDQLGSNSIQSAIAEGGRVIEEHIHYHVTDIDEAIRKERIRQKQQATSFTGR